MNNWNMDSDMEIKEENLFLHEELHKKQDQYP